MLISSGTAKSARNAITFNWCLLHVLYCTTFTSLTTWKFGVSMRRLFVIAHCDTRQFPGARRPHVNKVAILLWKDYPSFCDVTWSRLLKLLLGLHALHGARHGRRCELLCAATPKFYRSPRPTSTKPNENRQNRVRSRNRINI